MKQVAANRQRMTVILENVHDQHNIGAVMRTCDAVGIQEVYVLYTDDRLDEDHFYRFKKSASSAKKWLELHYFQDTIACFTAIKEKYDLVLATHLGADAKSIHDLDLTGNVALLFGNEKDGISQEALGHADMNMVIPQFGMVQSLNISVACAVTLYEALRQRNAEGMYGRDLEQQEERNQNIFKHYKTVDGRDGY